MEEELEKILEHREPMIDILEDRVDEDRYGNIYGTISPSINQIVDKINEIVLRINDLDSKIYKINKYLKYD